MQSPGIDYGRGLTNSDTATGTRYGVINQNEVLQAWADSSEADYGKPSWFMCPHCEEEYDINQRDSDPVINWGNDAPCRICGEVSTVDFDDFSEPIAFDYDGDGYICHQSADDPDIFVIKSPYYTYAQFCSPCAPGAGYLMSPFKTEIEPGSAIAAGSVGVYKTAAEAAGFPRVYCFGHDWFDEQETGRVIECRYCEGKGKRHYEGRQGAEFKTCHVCSGTGKVKEMVQRAPYPVFSVETGELIQP